MDKRLQVVLAQCGIASRRKAVSVIEEGHVHVNGVTIREKGFRIDTDKDDVSIDGVPIRFEKKVYYILNKPRGVITTVSDERGRKTVLDLIPKERSRIYPIGRLDRDTEGLLILTNDGDIAHRLTHPKFGVKRIYIAEVMIKSLEAKSIANLEKGVFIDGKKTNPCKINILEKNANKAFLRIELREGRKHEIRRMISKIGGGVVRLKRIEYGGIRLDSLPVGKARQLTKEEINQLKEDFSIYE